MIYNRKLFSTGGVLRKLFGDDGESVLKILLDKLSKETDPKRIEVLKERIRKVQERVNYHREHNGTNSNNSGGPKGKGRTLKGVIDRGWKYTKGSFTREALKKGTAGQRGVQAATALASVGLLYGSKKLYDKKVKDK